MLDPQPCLDRRSRILRKEPASVPRQSKTSQDSQPDGTRPVKTRVDDPATPVRDTTDLLDRRAGTLERGLAILGLLTDGRRLSAGQIAADLGLSRSATYRILGVLRQHGYVDWDESSESIHLGSQAVLLGVSALHSFDPFLAAQAALRALSQEVGEAALLAVRDGSSMVVFRPL
jgi:DNA-binding transcriptional ArsR family regulator